MTNIKSISLISVILFSFAFFGCKVDVTPTAESPKITYITPDVTTSLNKEVTLSVVIKVSDGGTLAYQWFRAIDKLEEGIKIQNINGNEELDENGRSQTLSPDVSVAGTYYYYCIITNTVQSESSYTVSPRITVTVQDSISAESPIIISQPYDITCKMGEKFSLEALAYSSDGGTLSYQWFYSSTTDGTVTAIEGATERRYKGNATENSFGYYYCVITNTINDNGDGGAKTSQITSDRIKIILDTINAKKPVILTQPQNIVSKMGDDFILSSSSYSLDEGTISYQWYYSATKDDVAIAIDYATEKSFKDKISVNNLGYYYCIITNSIVDNGDGGIKTAEITSDIAQISVNAISATKPIIILQPNNASYEMGTDFNFDVAAYSDDGGTLSYQWYYSTKYDEATTDNSVPVEGANKKTYSGKVSAATLGYYYCVITNTIADNGDGGIKTAQTYTNIAILSNNIVNANAPTILVQPSNTSAVISEKKTFIARAFSTDKGTLSYRWYKIPAGSAENAEGDPIDGGISEELEVTASIVGTEQYYCIITNTIADNGDGGTKSVSLNTEKATLTVNVVSAKEPIITVQPVNITAVMPDEVTFSTAAYSIDGGTLSYQWYSISEGSSQGIAIENATNKSYKTTASHTGTTKYYCQITSTITDNGDGGTKSKSIITESASLIVNIVNAAKPIIIAEPSNVSAVIPAVRTFSVSAYSIDNGNLTYQWYKIFDGETESTLIEGEIKSKLTVKVESTGKIGYYCVVTSTIVDNKDGGLKSASIITSTAYLESITLKAPRITEQPVAINIATYNHNINLSCKAESPEGIVLYNWYESADGTTATGTVINNANSSVFKTPIYTDKGLHYYYCVTTNVLSENDMGVKSEDTISNVVIVAYTGLPIVQIDTVNGEEPTCEYSLPPTGCYGRGIKNATKVPARMKIFKDGNNEAIYDSGEYVKKESGLTIKLRGNTSASLTSKTPYKLKLQKKTDLLAELIDRNDKEFKDKDWILLKDGTSLNTFVGMAVADIARTTWTPKFSYVNVIINGQYRGVYMLIEAISQSKKRIDVADDGYIIERDAYWWNEDIKFITDMNQKYTFKYPDSEDITDEQIEFIKNYMNTVEEHIKNGTYKDYIDIDSFARWFLIHDILGTKDWAGSNIYMTKYDSSIESNPNEDGTWSKIIMSTPWDFDTIYKRPDQWASIHEIDRNYSKILFLNSLFLESYKSLWTDISNNLVTEIQAKLSDIQSSIGNDLDISRQCDAKKWNTSYTSVEQNILEAEEWFISRKIWLDSAINEL